MSPRDCETFSEFSSTSGPHGKGCSCRVVSKAELALDIMRMKRGCKSRIFEVRRG